MVLNPRGTLEEDVQIFALIGNFFVTASDVVLATADTAALRVVSEIDMYTFCHDHELVASHIKRILFEDVFVNSIFVESAVVIPIGVNLLMVHQHVGNESIFFLFTFSDADFHNAKLLSQVEALWYKLAIDYWFE